MSIVDNIVQMSQSSQSQSISRAALTTPVFTSTNSQGFQNEAESQFSFYALQPNDALPYMPASEQQSLTSLKASPIAGIFNFFASLADDVC